MASVIRYHGVKLYDIGILGDIKPLQIINHVLLSNQHHRDPSSSADKMTGASSTDAIPGTVHLVDLDHTMHTRHAANGDRDIVLDPTPSNDPNDPLNWTPRRKLMAMITSNL